jgi:hypothetical protein
MFEQRQAKHIDPTSVLIAIEAADRAWASGRSWSVVGDFAGMHVAKLIAVQSSLLDVAKATAQDYGYDGFELYDSSGESADYFIFRYGGESKVSISSGKGTLAASEEMSERYDEGLWHSSADTTRRSMVERSSVRQGSKLAEVEVRRHTAVPVSYRICRLLYVFYADMCLRSDPEIELFFRSIQLGLEAKVRTRRLMAVYDDYTANGEQIEQDFKALQDLLVQLAFSEDDPSLVVCWQKSNGSSGAILFDGHRSITFRGDLAGHDEWLRAMLFRALQA